MAERANLRLIDPDTGEITEQGCPNCQTVGYQLDELTRKYHGVLAQLGKMRADKESEARSNHLWGLAIALFTDWRVATGRMRSKWTADRFWIAEPYLARDGFAVCRYAVWGLAAHPMVKRVTADFEEVYDDWELCFRDRAKFERHANRGAAIFGEDLPLAEFDALLRVHRRKAGIVRERNHL